MATSHSATIKSASNWYASERSKRTLAMYLIAICARSRGQSETCGEIEVPLLSTRSASLTICSALSRTSFSVLASNGLPFCHLLEQLLRHEIEEWLSGFKSSVELKSRRLSGPESRKRAFMRQCACDRRLLSTRCLWVCFWIAHAWSILGCTP